MPSGSRWKRSIVRVLVVHNRYHSDNPSGENVVVDQEVAALAEAGVDVVAYLRSSDEIERMSWRDRAAVPIGPLYAGRSVRDVERLIERQGVDVVHVHNVYPLVSPAVITAVKRRGLPVVHTVHNQRHVCARGTYFRDGHVCFECRERPLRLPSIVHGCYRDSRLQSVPMAASLVLHRDTWRMVDRFLALTDVIAEELIHEGIPRDRIVVRPNTAPDPGSPQWRTEPDVLFAGRLDAEKGIDLLLQAWRLVPSDGVRLRVAGDGPLAEMVHRAAAADARVVPLGRLSPEAVSREMRRARCVVVPSRCPEAFPRVVVEAFAHGRPVVATRLGGLPSIVTPSTGWIVDPQPDQLAAALTAALESRPDAGHAARTRYEQKFAPPVVLEQLLQTYEDVSGVTVPRTA